MTQPDIWYVAFGPDKTVKTDSNVAGTVRSTRTFKSEVDAKLFAMQILAKGWSASAGTLNPHQPKQIVPLPKWSAGPIQVWAGRITNQRLVDPHVRRDDALRDIRFIPIKPLSRSAPATQRSCLQRPRA